MSVALFELTTDSAGETEKLGREFAKLLAADHDLNSETVFVALYGTLGAGKTAFVRGMAAELVPSASVTSPTYAIVNEYKISKFIFAHFDMYRISGEDDLYSCGFDDYFRPGCLIAAEWSENIPFALPDEYYSVKLEPLSENGRRIIISVNSIKK